MADALNILLVEDSEDDAILLNRELKKGGISSRTLRVETAEALVSALETGDWDIVIADYVIPGFSGMEALRTVKERRPELPFILISGKRDEEVLIETLRAGAQDYVMKDKLHRLCPAIDLALRARDLFLEKKKAEKELQKVVSRFHLLANNISDIIWTTDLDGKFTFVSPSVTHVLGYRIEDLLGKKLEDLISPSDSEKVAQVVQKELGSPRNHARSPLRFKDAVEMEVAHKSGGSVWMETNVVILKKEKDVPSGFLAVSRNISDRKRREKEMALLALAFKQIGEGVVIMDHEGIIQWANAPFRRRSGFPLKNLLGKPVSMLTSGPIRDIPPPDFPSILRKGKPWKGMLQRQKMRGATYQVDASLYPMKGEDGRVVNFVYIERDITQELKTKDMVVQMQKMEALGTMAGGIAHDFNNLLMPIIVNTEMLLWDSGQDDSRQAYLHQILEAAQRGKRLMEQIISYSRKGSVEKKTVDVVSLVDKSLNFLRASLPSTVKIDADIKIEDGLVEGNASQIRQVLMNLCANAVEAMGDQGGRIVIGLDLEQFKAGDPLPDNKLKAGPYLRIFVSDTGPGIRPDILNRIFDPFFSTKEGGGSGMGLSVAQRIVADHRGIITVDSEQERGASFHLYLPIFRGKKPAVTPESNWRPGGSERILVVDDERSIVRSLRSMLKEMGYGVTGVTTCKEALELFADRPQAVDLVIIDQTMPELTGIEMAEELTRIRPDIPLILMTGFSETVSQTEAEKLGIDAFLTKPVGASEMALTVRRVLDGKK